MTATPIGRRSEPAAHEVICNWCRGKWFDNHPDSPGATIWCGKCDRKEIEAFWAARPNIHTETMPRHSLQVLMSFATDHTWGQGTFQAGKWAMTMKASLEMVLMFHKDGAWTADHSRRWMELQHMIGCELVHGEATARILCDVIREVLGDAPEFCVLPNG